MFQNQEEHLNYIKNSLYESQQFQQKFQGENQNQNQSIQQTQKTELLKFTIDIGNGRKGSIHIFEGDEPKELAEQFCDKYELDTNIVDILVENINQHLQSTISQVSQQASQFQDMGNQNSMSQRQSQVQEYSQHNESQESYQQQLPGGIHQNQNQQYQQQDQVNQESYQQQKYENQYQQLEQFNDNNDSNNNNYQQQQQQLQSDNNQQQQYQYQQQQSQQNNNQQSQNQQKKEQEYDQYQQQYELQDTHNFQKEFQHAEKLKNTESNENLLNTDQKSKIQQFLIQNQNKQNNQQQQQQLSEQNNNSNKNIQNNYSNVNSNNYNMNNNQNISNNVSTQFQGNNNNTNNKYESQQISNMQSQNKNPLLDENLQQSQNFQDNIGPSITNSMKKRIFQDFVSQRQSQVLEENNSYSQRSKNKNVLNSNNESINDFNYNYNNNNNNQQNQNIPNYKMHSKPYHSNYQDKENIYNVDQFQFIQNQSIDYSNQKSKRLSENKNIFNRESFYNKSKVASTAKKPNKQQQQQYYISSNCKVSNKPIYGKQTSVYDRLFNDAKKKQQNENEKILKIRQEEEQELKKKKLKRSKSMCDNNNNYNNQNIGNCSMLMYNNQIMQNNQGNEVNSGMRLYYRGIKQQEDLKKYLQSVKEEKEREKSQEYTYNPKINEISSIIASRQRQEPVGDYLNKVAKIQQERRDRARSYKQQAELDQCSFHPQINEISRQISIEKSHLNGQNKYLHNNQSVNMGNIDRFEMLFEDYKVQMERKKSKDMLVKQETQCTFKPKINKTSQLIVQDQNFYSRQERFLQHKNENIEFLQKQIMTPSKNSNQKPFQPQTGRANKNRNLRTGSVYENLYKQNPKHKQNNNNSHNQSINNISRSNSKLNNKSLERNTSFVNKQSKKMIDNIKNSKIKQIFDLLDSDNDGVISAQNIDISKLQPEILEIFSPLLIEMEELDQQLNFEEFQDAAERLIQTLTIDQKDMVLGVKKKTNSEVNYTFKPQINENSQIIANNIRPYGKQNLYNAYIEEKQQWTKRMQEQKTIEQQKEIKECSFTPTLNKSSNKYSKIKSKVYQTDVYNSNVQPLQKLNMQQQMNQQEQEKKLVGDEFIPYYYR